MTHTANDPDVEKPPVGFLVKLIGSGFFTGYAPDRIPALSLSTK